MEIRRELPLVPEDRERRREQRRLVHILDDLHPYAELSVWGCPFYNCLHSVPNELLASPGPVFILGNVSSFTQASQDLTPDIREHQIEAYIQDEYRVRQRNFTLTYGVRYSWFGQPIDKNGQLSNFSLLRRLFLATAAPKLFGNTTTGSASQSTEPSFPGQTFNPVNGIIVAGGTSPLTGPTITGTDYNDFAPRFGFAWDPWSTGKTSIRGRLWDFLRLDAGGHVRAEYFCEPALRAKRQHQQHAIHEPRPWHAEQHAFSPFGCPTRSSAAKRPHPLLAAMEPRRSASANQELTDRGRGVLRQ